MPNPDEDSPLSALSDLHGQVDALAAPLEDRHRERLQCGRGCTQCCVDDLSVFEIEAERIRRGAPEVLEQSPHPEGACAFLDSVGSCRIYAYRPYVCRTQGLPLRWLEQRADETVEVRDICPLNETDVPLSALESTECWTLGVVEGHLAALQAAYGGEPLVRRKLRDLFAKPRPGACE